MTIESMENRAERFVQAFGYTPEAQKQTVQAFIEELDCGLKRHKQDPDKPFNSDECSMMMMDTCATKLPTGNEKGVFYGIDVGGTNCRVVRVEFGPNSGSSLPKMSQITTTLRRTGKASSTIKPGGLLDETTRADELFDFIAEKLKSLMEEEGDLANQNSTQDQGTPVRIFPVGLTFSYGISQKSLTSAVVVNCAKELRTGLATSDPLLGSDVCQKLAAAFQRNSVPAELKAVLNDTTGTLYGGTCSKAPDTPPCSVGLIVGTGLNVCYMEPKAQSYAYSGLVINTECGGFNKKLPENEIDAEVDCASAIPKHQRLEKLVSGMYLGEICRRTVVAVFQEEAPQLCRTSESFSSSDAAVIFNDNNENLAETSRVLKTCWDWEATLLQRKHVKQLVNQIFNRSAALAAVVVAAIGLKMEKLSGATDDGITVSIDGSIWRKNQKYRILVQNHLQEILGNSIAANVHFCVAEDASGFGAAALAAAHV